MMAMVGLGDGDWARMMEERADAVIRGRAAIVVAVAMIEAVISICVGLKERKKGRRAGKRYRCSSHKGLASLHMILNRG